MMSLRSSTTCARCGQLKASNPFYGGDRENRLCARAYDGRAGAMPRPLATVLTILDHELAIVSRERTSARGRAACFPFFCRGVQGRFSQ